MHYVTGNTFLPVLTRQAQGESVARWKPFGFIRIYSPSPSPALRPNPPASDIVFNLDEGRLHHSFLAVRSFIDHCTLFFFLLKQQAGLRSYS